MKLAKCKDTKTRPGVALRLYHSVPPHGALGYTQGVNQPTSIYCCNGKMIQNHFWSLYRTDTNRPNTQLRYNECVCIMPSTAKRALCQNFTTGISFATSTIKKLDMCLWNTDAPGGNKVKLCQKSLSPTFWPPPTPRGTGCQWSVRNQ